MSSEKRASCPRLRIEETTEQFSIAAQAVRREYSNELKTELLAMCQEPRAGVGGVEIAHNLHRNMLHCWMREARLARALSGRSHADPPEAFMPIPLAAVSRVDSNEPLMTAVVNEHSGKHRVARLMCGDGIRSQTGYQRSADSWGHKPTVVVPNHLNRQFTSDGINQSRVTDIAYIRTHEGWLYLAVVLDLFSRHVIGWSMGSRLDTDLVLNALIMAPWRRQTT